jgi:hypothetical protein
METNNARPSQKWQRSGLMKEGQMNQAIIKSGHYRVVESGVGMFVEFFATEVVAFPFKENRLRVCEVHAVSFA